MLRVSVEVWRKLRSLAFGAVLVVMALSNVLLIKQNLEMRGELHELKPRMLEVGSKAETFVAPGLRGELFSVNYTGKGPKRVFIYFSPGCPYCSTQFSYWVTLLNNLDRERFQVMGLVSESEDKSKVSEYLHGIGCDHLETAFVSNSVLRNYSLSITPTTLVVASDGRVEKAWPGVWDAGTLASARSLFGLSFESN